MGAVPSSATSFVQHSTFKRTKFITCKAGGSFSFLQTACEASENLFTPFRLPELHSRSPKSPYYWCHFLLAVSVCSLRSNIILLFRGILQDFSKSSHRLIKREHFIVNSLDLQWWLMVAPVFILKSCNISTQDSHSSILLISFLMGIKWLTKSDFTVLMTVSSGPPCILLLFGHLHQLT